MNIKLPFRISNDLKNQLLEFALFSGLNYFSQNSAGLGRRFCCLDNYDIELTRSVKQFSNNCYGYLGTRVIKEHLFGNFIGVNDTDAFVHQHTDPKNEFGFDHVRLNFMLSQPDQGGQPVIDGVEYKISEGESWINVASSWMHGTTPVIGNKKRVILSLGSYVDPNITKNILTSVDNLSII